MTTKAELQKQIDELQDKLDAMPDDKPASTGRWKPELGGNYYFIHDSGTSISCTEGISSAVDKMRYRLGNSYRTRKEAEKAIDQQLATVRVLDRIAELNAEQGWVCDWDDHDQIKSIFRFDHDDRTFYFDSTYLTQWHQSQYFGSTQTIETVIKEMRSDCLLMLGVSGVAE